MKKISTVGILSDSHDNMVALKKAVDLFNERETDLVIHAGDLVAPFTAQELKRLTSPLIITFGNNDGEVFGLSKVFEGQIHQPPHEVIVNDKRVLILHDPVHLESLKKSDSVDVIIYGHLHRIDIQHGRPMIISPGECGGWLTGKSTVAIWDTEKNDVEIVTL